MNGQTFTLIILDIDESVDVCIKESITKLGQ